MEAKLAEVSELIGNLYCCFYITMKPILIVKAKIEAL